MWKFPNLRYMQEDVWLIKLHHCNYCCSDTSIGYLHLWWTFSSSPPQCSALPNKYSQALSTFNSILQETESWVGTQEQGYDVSQHQTLYKINQYINKVVFQTLLILSISCSTTTRQWTNWITSLERARLFGTCAWHFEYPKEKAEDNI